LITDLAPLLTPSDQKLRPILIVEVERNVTPEVLDTLTRSMKYMAETNVISCIMVMTEAYATFALKPGMKFLYSVYLFPDSRRDYFWVSDFTEAQASAYLDKRNFRGRLNQEIGVTDESYEQKKREIFAQYGTRPLHLSKLVESPLPIEDSIQEAIEEKYESLLTVISTKPNEYTTVLEELCDTEKLAARTYIEITKESPQNSELVRQYILTYDFSTRNFFFWSKPTKMAAVRYLDKLSQE
jgi:hypothetical protein